MIIEAWRRKKKNIQLPFHLLLQGWCSRWNKPLTFSSTSIKSTQPCDTCTRQMTPPWYRTAFLLGVLLLSVQHKHWIINPPSNLLLCVSLCVVFSWLFWGFFFYSFHSAFFSTCAGSMPGLQTRLRVFPALAPCHASLPGSLPHHLGKNSQLFALLSCITIPLHNWPPHPLGPLPLISGLGPDCNTQWWHSSRSARGLRKKKVRVGAKVKSHHIMRLALSQLRGMKSKGVFIAEVWNHFCEVGCGLPAA